MGAFSSGKICTEFELKTANCQKAASRLDYQAMAYMRAEDPLEEIVEVLGCECDATNQDDAKSN